MGDHRAREEIAAVVVVAAALVLLASKDILFPDFLQLGSRLFPQRALRLKGQGSRRGRWAGSKTERYCLDALGVAPKLEGQAK